MLKKVLSTLLFAMMLQITAFAQITVYGHVEDAETHEALIGVGVMVKGTPNTGTVTDVDGNYQLRVDAGATLIYSFIGYAEQEITVNGRARIDVALSVDMNELDELVVVGYGTQKKANITGSVAQVSMDKIAANRPVTSVADAIEGTIPGLTLSGNTGEPGAGTNYTIRGTSSINGSSPLILVDGIAMDLSMINPNDIESITVLKDASASAIYGARAAFGVILVNTKKAEKERAPQITFSSKITMSNPQELPQRSDPVTTLQGLVDGTYPTFAGGQIHSVWLDLQKQYETNPAAFPDGYIIQDNVKYYLAHNDLTGDFLTTGIQQNYDLTVTGGSARTTYRIAAGILNEDGVVVTDKDSYSRYNITSFVNSKVTNWLAASLSMMYSHTDKLDPFTVNVSGRSPWTSCIGLMPNYPTGGMDIDGTYVPYFTPKSQVEASTPAKYLNDRVNLLGKLVLTPIKGLDITGEYSINKTFGKNTRYTRPLDFRDGRDDSAAVKEALSRYTTGRSETTYTAANLYATYTKAWGDHSFKAMAGFNAEENNWENLSVNRVDMINEEMPSLGQATGDTTPSDNFSDYSIMGTFYRLNYSWKDRYLLELSGRYDGSSKFPAGNRWGFFPSFSLGWRLSKEPFLRDVHTLNNLLLRFSLGTIGNQNINPYLYMPTMSSSSKANWAYGGEKFTTLSTPSLVRSEFTWETVRTINAGLDWSLFNSRLSGTFDIFRRSTKDMLGPGADYPAVLGAGAPYQNCADMHTDGWEFSIRWNDTIGDFYYNIGFNISDARSFIDKYNNPTKLLSLPYYEGKELGEIWGYVSDRLYTVDDFVEGTLQSTDQGPLTGGTLKEGVSRIKGSNPNPGDMMYLYADENGDVWNSANTVDDPGSRRIIGNSTARMVFGINTNFEWKGIGLSLLFSGVGKRDLWMRNSVVIPFDGSQDFALYDNLLDYWTPDNTDAYYCRIYRNAQYNHGNNYNVQTRYLMNGAFIDLKSAVLSYTFQKSLLDKIHIKGLTVFVSGENLFSFNHTPKGVHPNGSIRGSSDGYSNGGFAYPLMRKVTFGANIKF